MPLGQIEQFIDRVNFSNLLYYRQPKKQLFYLELQLTRSSELRQIQSAKEKQHQKYATLT